MPDTARDAFVKNLRDLMEAKGISQADICRELDISSATVSDWCTGKKYPRMDKVELLANYFGILKSDLIEDKSSEQWEMQIKNDTLASVIVRMRTDEKFFAAAELLERLEPEQLEMVVQFLKTFVK